MFVHPSLSPSALAMSPALAFQEVSSELEPLQVIWSLYAETQLLAHNDDKWHNHQNDIADTLSHQFRVTMLADAMAEHIGLDHDTRISLFYAGLLHDMGKFKLDPDMLFVEGKLDDTAREAMQAHPRHSAEIILKHLPTEEGRKIAQIVLEHHEHTDGSGYPNKLTENRISLAGKILCAADVYDALSKHRCYKDPLSRDKVESIMREGQDKTHPREIIETCFHVAHTVANRLHPTHPTSGVSVSAPFPMPVVH